MGRALRAGGHAARRDPAGSRNATQQSLLAPDVVERARATGMAIRFMLPAELDATVKGDLDYWSKVIREAKITADRPLSQVAAGSGCHRDSIGTRRLEARCAVEDRDQAARVSDQLALLQHARCLSLPTRLTPRTFARGFMREAERRRMRAVGRHEHAPGDPLQHDVEAVASRVAH